MTIFGIMPVKNEADRYLKDALLNAANVVDTLFVYDDQSTDDTIDIVWEVTPNFWVRRDDVPTFLEHEGRFRQDCWNQFESQCQPKAGDWVLAVDADEALIAHGATDPSDTWRVVREEIKLAEQSSVSIRLPVPEVYGRDDDGTPLVRQDGFWAQVRGLRLFQWRPGGVFRDAPMGCGSEPTYVAHSMWMPSPSLYLMHFGYEQLEDQIAKHKRYTSLLDHGHDNSHVQSIVGEKRLVRWTGPVPTMRRGIR